MLKHEWCDRYYKFYYISFPNSDVVSLTIFLKTYSSLCTLQLSLIVLLENQNFISEWVCERERDTPATFC